MTQQIAPIDGLFTADPGGIDTPVDVCELRTEVQAKYRAVAETPEAEFHFHTGRVIAERARYDLAAFDDLPRGASDSFAGVANPFELRSLEQGENVVDLGSGAGTDALLAATWVGPEGNVIGVDMTQEMLDKAESTAADADFDNVEFRFGYLEEVPVEDGWADVVISNGVINLCPDKGAVMEEIWRILRPGGTVQFADIANGKDVPEAARHEIDLWTG